MGKILRVGRISYLNTDPFFAGWQASEDIRLLSTTPHELGDWAKKGKIDAGLLSLVDFWDLERDFEPLGDLGIAVKKDARSVLLFSKVPATDLGKSFIGVTDETSTSVELLKILLKQRWGAPAVCRGGFSPTDAGRLLIGDKALLASEKGLRGFSHVTDLGQEWHRWQGLPFVFARWAVRKNAPAYLKDALLDALEASLNYFLKNKDKAAAVFAKSAGVDRQHVLDYLGAFNYRFTAKESDSQALFRDYWLGKAVRCLC